jgi:hypothetical protein
VALLAARGRRWDPVEGKNQGFVIGPQLEGAALQPRAKVFYTWHGGEKFSVEGGIVYLGFGELLAEKSQWLPVLAYLLSQDCSDMGVRGVGSQGKDSSGEGEGQGNCGNEGRLRGGESGFHVRCPGEGLGVTWECGGERAECNGDAGEETLIEIFIPRNLCIVLQSVGLGKSKMTWMLSQRGATLAAEMRWPRKSSSEAGNTHFSRLTARPLAARMVNNVRRWV